MEPRWQFSARDDSEWPQVLIEPTIDPATVLSDVGTVAGRSAPGYVRPGHDDGPGWAASFRSPMGLAAAADYQVFVADADNHAVRRIFGDGYVETIAGGDGHGFVDGRGAAARFFNPHGVAWRSSDGAVFVADTSNHAVRMISASQPGASGVVSTVWGAAGAGYATAEHRGNGTAALTNAPPSGLWNPQGVAIWRDGLLVADTDNHRILQLSPRSGGGWRLRAFAGTGNKGFEGATAFVASFRYPRSVAVCAGGAEVLVADSGNHAIRRVVAGPMTDSKGVEGLDWGEHAVVETLAGNGLPGIEDSRTRQEKPKASVLLTYQLAAQFALPYGVACAADGGALVSDTDGAFLVRRDAHGVHGFRVGHALGRRHALVVGPDFDGTITRSRHVVGPVLGVHVQRRHPRRVRPVHTPHVLSIQPVPVRQLEVATGRQAPGTVGVPRHITKDVRLEQREPFERRRARRRVQLEA